jgi:hypothetical protein
MQGQPATPECAGAGIISVMTPLFPPPSTPLAQCRQVLRHQGHAVLAPAALSQLAGVPLAEFDALRSAWNRLPPDTYLRDGGRYRRRRHACYTIEGETLSGTARRAHWQPVEYNALHGGLERWFEAIEPEVTQSPAWSRLLMALGGVASDLKGRQTWYVEAHQFRIDTTDGIGRPTPEGAHRDGVDLVAVLLVDRHAVKGGETRVFDALGPSGQRFTMHEPWTALLLDDERVVHETTPIQPVAEGGFRDTLVVTCRAGGFQGPQAP